MSHAVLVASTNPILFFRAFDTDGTAKVNLLAAEAGLTLSVYRTGGSSVAISSLSDKAADDTAHADGAIRQVSGNLYTVDAPDAAVAAQFGSVSIKGSYTAGTIDGVPHPLVGYNGADGVRLGVTALPNAVADAAGGLPISDAGGLDLDAIFVDVDTTIPDLIGGIGSTGGAALPVEATSDNAAGAIIGGVTVLGTQTLTYAATEADDNIYHVITGTATALDWVYGFVLGGGYVAAGLKWKGFVNSANDDITVQAWNGSTWDTRKIIAGAGGSNDSIELIELLARHTTSGGLVYLRFVTSGDTNPELHTNQLSVQKVNTSRTVGYNDGISVDTLAGVAGTEAWYNGTGDQPALTWADAQTIAAAVGLKHYHITNGSSVTLDQATDNTEITGDEFTIALGGYSIDNTSLHNGLMVTGTFLGYPHILDTGVGAAGITGPGAKLGFCAIRGPVVSDAATYTWVLHDCWGVSASVSEFDFGAAVVAAQTVYITSYHGPLNVSNMDHASDILYLSGEGTLVISASSTTGTIYLSGQWDVTNNGTTTIVYDDITTDVTSIDTAVALIPTTAMRGTDGANTVVPDASGAAATLHAATDAAVALIPTTAMRGTDGANTVVPDTAAVTAAAVWNAAQAGYVTVGTFGYNLDARVSDSVPTAGTGARTITFTVTDGVNPLENATVRATEGVNSFAATTDVSGNCTFNLDDATYVIAVTKVGYSYAGSSLVVTANATPAVAMTTIVVLTPADPNQSTGTIRCYDELGAAKSGVVISAVIQNGPGPAGLAFNNATWSETSDVNGDVSFVGLVQGAVYRAYRGTETSSTEYIEFQVPVGRTSFLIAELIGTE